ncbi:P-loop containing nucleoside triphosphate hydrolase protein [Trichoderma ceciliae]
MIVPSSLTWRSATRTRPLSYTIKPLFSHSNPHDSSRFFKASHSLLRQRENSPSFTPSREQQKIVKLCIEQNVVVSARPGSGKTATAEAIAAAYPDKRLAVLTYSKRLQLETHRRLLKYPNCNVFTFHAMASSLFGDTVWNDTKLLQQRTKVNHCNELPQSKLVPFDIIVLDEFQDCTELIFWLTGCFIQANKQKTGDQSARLVVLGDERQSIYKFRGADHRYLTLAAELLGPMSPYPFIKVPLSQSFRLSKHCVRFINRTFLGGESYITSSKPGPKPIVLRCYRRDIAALAKKLSTLIKHQGAKNSAIIAPSVRKNDLVKRLTNVLAEEYRVPIAVPLDDDAPLDDKVTDGKMCVSTIHQFKGSERDLVILFGVDSSFFRIFGRDLPDDSCPNEIFVALTRAAKQLVLVHEEDKKLMPFVSVKALYETADVISITNSQAKMALPDAPGRALEIGLFLPPSVGPQDMTRHIQDESLDGIIKRDLCIRRLSPALSEKDHINIRHVVPSDLKRGFHEAVSDINSLVVVAAFEHDIAGTLNSLALDKNIVNETLPVCPQQRVSWLCRHACEYEARFSGYLPRVIQMENHKFDWIKPEDLALARSRLQGQLRDLAPNLRFEMEANQIFCIGNKKTTLQGRADIVTFSSASDCNEGKRIKSIWEIKFVTQLSNEHILQACVYAYLLTPQSEELPRIILYNVRDGEKLEITPRDGREGLRRTIECALRLRYTTKQEVEDEAFIKTCRETTLEVLNLDKSSQ